MIPLPWLDLKFFIYFTKDSINVLKLEENSTNFSHSSKWISTTKFPLISDLSSSITDLSSSITDLSSSTTDLSSSTHLAKTKEEFFETNKHLSLNLGNGSVFRVNESVDFIFSFIFSFTSAKLQNFTFYVDLDETIPTRVINVVGQAPPYYVGLHVPRNISSGDSYTDPDTSPDPHRYNFNLPNIEFKFDAILKGFEVYALAGGGYYLSVYDPCNGTNVPCIEDVYKFRNYTPTYIEKYKWIPSLENLLKAGYNYIHVNNVLVCKSWSVYLYLPWDSTKIAWDTSGLAPISDYATKGESKKLNENRNWRLYIRAEIDRYQETVKYAHTFEKAGTYNVKIYNAHNRLINAIKTITIID